MLPALTALPAPAVACELAEALVFGGESSLSCTFSETSSSISVASVPFDVTGDGPTISFGLINEWCIVPGEG